MFKTLRKVNNLFAEINEILNQINSVDAQIITKQEMLNTSYSNLKEEVANYINDVQQDINSFGLLNNNRTYYGTKDFFVDFTDGTYLENNSGFSLDQTQGILVSERNSYFQYNNFKSEYDSEYMVYSAHFDESVILNLIQYSFIAVDGDPIIPVSIFFNDKAESQLYESWMDRLKRNDLNTEYINNFYLSPKSVRDIYFVFNKSIDPSQSRISFTRNNYNIGSNIVYKFPFSDKKGFVLYKNDFDDKVEINYEYSINGSDYSPISFSDQDGDITKLGKVILNEKTTTSETYLYIRTVRGSIKFKDDNTKIIQEQVVQSGSEVKQDDISYRLSFGSEDVDSKNVSIVVPSTIYDSYYKYIPDFFQKTVDGLIEIKSSYIKYLPSITDVQKLTLRNQNSISVFESVDPIIYYTDNNTIYMPKLFATNDISFIYSRLEQQNIFEPNDYTPIVFDITLDTI